MFNAGQELREGLLVECQLSIGAEGMGQHVIQMQDPRSQWLPSSSSNGNSCSGTEGGMRGKVPCSTVYNKKIGNSLNSPAAAKSQ